MAPGIGLDIEDRLMELFPAADCIIFGHTHMPVRTTIGQDPSAQSRQFSEDRQPWRRRHLCTSLTTEKGSPPQYTNCRRIYEKSLDPMAYGPCPGPGAAIIGLPFRTSRHRLAQHGPTPALRDSDNLVLLNRFPYSNGHLLVAPVRHVADLTELNENETASLMLMLRQSGRILKLRLAPHGLNIGCNLGRQPAPG